MADRSSPNMAVVSLAAGLVGAGLALLLAPRSGKDTRQAIKQRSTDLKQQAESDLHRVRDSLNTTVEKTRGSLSDALSKKGHKAEEQYDEFGEQIERTGAKQSQVLRAWEEEA